MATATAILNEKYASKDGTYPIIIRLINGKKQKLHPVKFKIAKKYWLEGQVSDDHPEADIINSIIDEEVLTAKRYFRDCRLQNIPIDLELVFKAVKSHNFTSYLMHRAKQHKEAEQVEMMNKCNRYVKEFTYCFGRDIYFSEITQDLLRRYETWLQKANPELKKKVNVENTRHKKFEFLAKYYKNAMDEGKAQAPNPFAQYSIKTTPVHKQKLTKEQFKAIEELPLKPGKLCLARDIFLFSYYCKGARFETCLLMKKSAITNGRLHFRANKGLKFLSVQIHPKLQALIDRYIDNNTDTIFGRVDGEFPNKTKRRSKIGSENYMVNRELKKVAELCEIAIPLSMHHARHSLAFHLKKNKADIHAIKQALGHSRTQTTEIYLTDLDDESIDPVMNEIYNGL
jgi:integrase/recombinase XerD